MSCYVCRACRRSQITKTDVGLCISVKMTDGHCKHDKEKTNNAPVNVQPHPHPLEQTQGILTEIIFVCQNPPTGLERLCQILSVGKQLITALIKFICFIFCTIRYKNTG